MEGRNRVRFLMWYGDIVAEYKLTPQQALVLFLAQRYGSYSVVSDNCIAAATKGAREKNKRLLEALVGKGLIDSYEHNGRGKKSRWRITINDDVYDKMLHAYNTKTHCFRVDAIFRNCIAKLNVSEMVVWLALKNLQLMDGFTISTGTLQAYTGMSYSTIYNALEKNEAISSRLERKYIVLDNIRKQALYRIQEDKEESLFITPHRLQDKVYTVSKALVRNNKASKIVREYIYNIHMCNWDCYNATTTLTVLQELCNDPDLRKATKRLFGYDMRKLQLNGYYIHGYKVTRDANSENLQYA